MTWRTVRDLPPPIDDKYELVEGHEYPLTLLGPDTRWVMRRHAGKLQIRKAVSA